MIRTSLLTTRDEARWRAALPADACVMGSVEYARIVERCTGCVAHLFVAEPSAGGGIVAYPFLLRPVATLPFAPQVGPVRFDTFTPEYTGPLRIGPAALPPGVFEELFAGQCRELGVAAEFAHLNPWSFPADLLDPACVEVDREVVWVDLTWGEDRLWRESLTTDARRHTKQAQRAGVRVRRAGSLDDVREFHRLYALTMDRRGADDRYRFPLEHFAAFFETMPGNAFFVLAEHGDRAVAGGLYLQGGTDVYWHLSAADMEASRVRPVNAYVHDTIVRAARGGMKRMLCGGGYAPDDGVFRFKAGFSPLRAPFRTYKRIHDAAAYTELLRAWSAHHGGSAPRARYFPAYRAA